jgi:hypothetical protein
MGGYVLRMPARLTRSSHGGAGRPGPRQEHRGLQLQLPAPYGSLKDGDDQASTHCLFSKARIRPAVNQVIIGMIIPR